MFFDKVLDFSVSFSVQCSAELFTAHDPTRTVSPHSKNADTFYCDRLKDDRDSLVTDAVISLKLIRLADRRQLHQIMHNSL
jgi:hypothetical protein